MEKVSLQNMKIILISITILVVVVLLLKLQIASTTSKNQTSLAEQSKVTNSEEDSVSQEKIDDDETKEEIEEDESDKKAARQENSRFIFPEDDFEYTNKNIGSNKEYIRSENELTKKKLKRQTAVEEIPEKETVEKEIKVVIPKPQKTKTPREMFDFALSEMKKGNYNSAIYEFNNALDAADNIETAMKARRYLAKCYEIKGIYSEAYNILEYIYLETNSKSDLLELCRLAKKTNRIYTAQNYIQGYLELYPDDYNTFSQYLQN